MDAVSGSIGAMKGWNSASPITARAARRLEEAGLFGAGPEAEGDDFEHRRVVVGGSLCVMIGLGLCRSGHFSSPIRVVDAPICDTPTDTNLSVEIMHGQICLNSRPFAGQRPFCRFSSPAPGLK